MFYAVLTWKLPSSDCFDINQLMLSSISLVSILIPILSNSTWSLASRSVVMVNDVNHMLWILFTRILLDKCQGGIPKLASLKLFHCYWISYFYKRFSFRIENFKFRSATHQPLKWTAIPPWGCLQDRICW